MCSDAQPAGNITVLKRVLLPSLFYIKLVKWRYWWEPKIFCAFALIVAGAIFGIIATVVTVTRLFLKL